MIDENIYDLQKCSASSSSVVTGIKIGIRRENICPAPLDWFVKDEDFIQVERGSDGFVVAREETDPNGAWATTKSGLVTNERSLTIQATRSSRLVQRMMQIAIENQGSKGRVFQGYSDGGFHIIVELKDETIGLSWIEVSPNVKTGNIMDTFWNDYEADESQFEFTFSIEEDPVYYLNGVYGDNFALPGSFGKIEITNDVPVITATEITISNLAFVDPDTAAYSSVLTIKTKDSTGLEIAQNVDTDVVVTDIILSGDFVTGESYVISYYYEYSSVQKNEVKQELVELAVTI